jgi:hypothetical protein
VREVVGEIRVGPDVSSGQGPRSSAIAEVRK